MEFPGEKLVIKLWETLAERGIGSMFEPGHIRRTDMARTEVRAAEILMLAQAEAYADDIRAGRKDVPLSKSMKLLGKPAVELLSLPYEKCEQTWDTDSLVEVALRAQTADVIKKEINVTRAVFKAEEALATDLQDPSPYRIDEDWLTSWRDHAGRVSTEDLQQLWGRVLAGELKAPGTHSLRTLEFMKGLSKSEAENISRLACFVIERKIFRAAPEVFAQKGFTLDFFLQMQELGVISGVDSLGLSSDLGSASANEFLRLLRGNGKAILVTHDDAGKKLLMPVYLLTAIGAEILSLGSFSCEPDYLTANATWIAGQGFKVLVGDWSANDPWTLSNEYEVAIAPVTAVNLVPASS